MKAIYFDGKSTKPYKVTVKHVFNGLEIFSKDAKEGINRFWNLEEVKSESFSNREKLLLSYGEYPYERLEVSGQGTERIINAVLKSENKIKNIQHSITKMNPFTVTISSLVVISAVVSLYLMVISPWVGEQAVKIIPINLEQKIGESMYKSISFSLDINEEKSKKLDTFFHACNFKSEYDITFDYADEKIINAFAVPGGQIVIYDGLIKETKCWDELAALMGHELAHVNQQHSFKQLARSITGYLFLSVLTGDVAGASGVLLENASQIKELSNSRAHEKEADMVGLEYLKKSQIRASAMIDLFSRLKSKKKIGDYEISKIEQGIEFLSTHPSSENRMDYIKEQIDNDISFKYEAIDISVAARIWEELKNDLD